MLETINRDILILFPKQPLIDWVNYIFPDNKMQCPKLMEHDGANVYLIPEFDHPDQALVFLKENYKHFFKNELFDWCTDEKEWPQKQTWDLFEQWFHYSIQSIVIDTLKGHIKKDAY